MSKRRRAAELGAIIHGRGETQLDRVLEFVAFVGRSMPLTFLLDEAPQRIASIVRADVASLYLLEGDGDELVLRGNVGFPQAARGSVRLSVGEGLTGLAVECLRPISVVSASTHENFRRFRELDEDRFPVFLAVPILGHSQALGALVVQRQGTEAFSAADINLIVALTAPISAGLRQAQLLDEQREKMHRRTGGGTRKVTLPGLPVVSGLALGAVAALRRPASSPRLTLNGDELERLDAAFEIAARGLEAISERARALGLASEAGFLETYKLIATEALLRERARSLVKEGSSIAQALGTVAREAVRAASGTVGGPFMQERARDIEDFCDALVMLASPDARAELPSKAVLLGDELTVFDLLVSARAQPVGIALTSRAPSPRSMVLLKLMGVPAIVDVGGAFRWAAPGDVALLDAEHGLLIVNPSRSEVARLRAKRKSRAS